MTKHSATLISAKDIQTFQAEGVVKLSGVFSQWVSVLNTGAQTNIDHPSERALTHQADNQSGQFVEDFCNWQRIEEYTEFVTQSPLGQIAANLMQSSTAQFFHDHFLYKEANSAVPTPWHQDMPYYCVNGMQTVSFWIPLNAREQSVSLRLATRSHQLPKEIRPTSWSSNESFYDDNAQFMDMPDIDNGEFEIRQWAMQPGDAIAFDFRTIHGAYANTLPCANRTLSFRLVGDDACYFDRGGRTSPNFPEINQQSGERLREDWFPVVFNSSADAD